MAGGALVLASSTPCVLHCVKKEVLLSNAQELEQGSQNDELRRNEPLKMKRDTSCNRAATELDHTLFVSSV